MGTSCMKGLKPLFGKTKSTAEEATLKLQVMASGTENSNQIINDPKFVADQFQISTQGIYIANFSLPKNSI